MRGKTEIPYAISLGKHSEYVFTATDSFLNTLRIQQVDTPSDAVRVGEAFHLDNVFRYSSEAVAAMPAGIGQNGFGALGMPVIRHGVPQVNACSPA